MKQIISFLIKQELPDKALIALNKTEIKPLPKDFKMAFDA
jgi:hypothetical protein